MLYGLRAIFSNDWVALAHALGDDFFAPSSRPFENRIVVVPNPNLKDFLLHSLCEHPRLKIAAGIQVLPLNQAVMEILDRAANKIQRKRIPSVTEMSLAIEEKLQTNGEEPSLKNYLSGTAEQRCQRMALLSDELAKCFSQYGLYGEQFLSHWLEKEGWQQKLWKSLFNDATPWTYPLELLKDQTEGFEGKIALFGFTHLSPVHLQFFSTFSASLYHFSPCAHFWEDFTSDKERISTTRAYQRKGANRATLDQLDGYLKQHHPLLANWGKLGRLMLKSLEPLLIEEREVYREARGKSLLSKLQNSLLTLDESEPLQVDDSIQLHSATSKLREVEALRDSLETLLQNHLRLGDSIRPQDIVITCPDIPGYAAYIHMVFSQSPFTYFIEGMPVISMSPAVQGFMQLLKLPAEDYALQAVIRLLRCEPLMEKHDFSFDEINLLSRWLKQANIKWGLEGNPNSWEEGLNRLLYGLAVDTDVLFEVSPLGTIPQSEIELFNRFLTFFFALKKDLSHLAMKKTASDWFEFFLYLNETYFLAESEPFFQELKALCSSCRPLREGEWSFESIVRILQQLSKKNVRAHSSSQLESIAFVPLSPGNLRAARVIACLGMGEGAFPRKEVRSSLCEMLYASGADDYPLREDEDRALMLEMLACASDHLLLSYQRIHPEDGKQQGPALLIDELNHYLRKRGIEEGMMAIDHPAFPLDRSYFSATAVVKKWSEADLHAAEALESPAHAAPAFFHFKSFAALLESEIAIDIRQLRKLARNPLKFYLNESLKIYLQEDEDTEEEEWKLSNLHSSVLRKKTMQMPLERLLEHSSAQGTMPHGLFKSAAVLELEEKSTELMDLLKKWDISPSEIHSVRFSLLSHADEQDYRPPLAIPLSDGRVVYITGVLEEVTPKGWIAHADGDLKSLVALWPLYLIYRCLEPSSTAVLLTKKGTALEIPLEDPKSVLTAYLEYYLLALQNPSPLMPEWAKAILEGGEEQFKEVMQKELENPYVNYLKRRHALFEPRETLALWDAPLKKAFGPLIKGGRG